jgi:RNA polymerase sigma-70 factor (ECF subfamily)
MRALGELFSRYHSDLYNFLSRLSGTDHAELDDLVQITFLEVHKSARRFLNQSGVRSWIFAIGSNVARHDVRSAVRRKSTVRILRDASVGETAPRNQQDYTDRRMLMHDLSVAIGALSHKLRVVFIMCEVEGIPGVEAAKALGIREGTLWRRLHDARRKLAETLERRA